MRFPGFIGGSYELGSKNIDAQRCVNMYLQADEMGTGKEGEKMALFPCPGLITKLTLAGGQNRGAWLASDGEWFAVGGNKLYSISPSYVATELGTLNTSTGPVSMSDNGTCVVVCDGTETLYVWNINTTTFSTLTTADNYQAADTVTYQDGYFIFNASGKNQFFFSTGQAVVAFDGADFESSEGSPDSVVGVISVLRNLWVFNEQTTEVYFNSGDANAPWQRIEGSFIDIGCAAKFSIKKIADSVFWLGKSTRGEGIVYMATGLQSKRISTHAIEQAISQYATISDAEAWCYEHEGHAFYALSFPTGNATWVYDLATESWHERAYLSSGSLGRHRARTHIYIFGKHLVGDYSSGKIYELSHSTYDDDGAAVQRIRSSPHVTAGLDRVFYQRFQLDIMAGVGMDGSGQGSDPQVILQFSDDGGYTWSNEKWASFGAIGARLTRAIWRRLGMSRDRVFRVTITDPVKVVILGAEIDLEREAS